MAFIPFHENPEVQKAAFHALENKILTTFSENKKDIYDNALEIYKKETGDSNLYITKENHYINGALANDLYTLHYKENRDASRFWNIFYTLEHKNGIGRYMQDAEIEIYLKPTNGGILPQDHEHIIGKLVDKDEEYATIKLNKDGDLRTINYADIAIIID